MMKAMNARFITAHNSVNFGLIKLPQEGTSKEETGLSKADSPVLLLLVISCYWVG